MVCIDSANVCAPQVSSLRGQCASTGPVSAAATIVPGTMVASATLGRPYAPHHSPIPASTTASAIANEKFAAKESAIATEQSAQVMAGSRPRRCRHPAMAIAAVKKPTDRL